METVALFFRTIIRDASDIHTGVVKVASVPPPPHQFGLKRVGLFCLCLWRSARSNCEDGVGRRRRARLPRQWLRLAEFKHHCSQGRRTVRAGAAARRQNPASHRERPGVSTPPRSSRRGRRRSLGEGREGGERKEEQEKEQEKARKVRQLFAPSLEWSFSCGTPRRGGVVESSIGDLQLAVLFL